MRTACNHCGREIQPTSSDWICPGCHKNHTPGVRTHFVDFSLMGVMAPVPEYQNGDSISYGGMIYKPDLSSGAPVGRMIHIPGDGRHSWGASEGTKHYAHMWGNKTFYCS